MFVTCTQIISNYRDFTKKFFKYKLIRVTNFLNYFFNVSITFKCNVWGNTRIMYMDIYSVSISDLFLKFYSSIFLFVLKEFNWAGHKYYQNWFLINSVTLILYLIFVILYFGDLLFIIFIHHLTFYLNKNQLNSVI